MVILITGISSGFGLEMAKALSERGHMVYGTVRRECDRLPGVRYLTLDVTDDEQVSETVRTLIAEQGRIDVLINNAGYGVGGPIEFMPMEDVQKQMDVNFTGLVRMVKAVLPYMRERKDGKIIAFSSIGGLLGLPFQAYYSASKFAIEGFCEALRIETRGYGIKVTVVEPGDFQTGFTGKRKKISDSDAFCAYPSYGRSMESIENDENTGLLPSYLSKRIVKIVEKNNPACSYMIATPVQKASVLLKRLLPEMWFSKIIGAFYKM